MDIDTSLNEKKIQSILGSFIASPKYSVEGLFVFRWESDKLLWTKAWYIYEFEIKISRSDYKNDFKHKAEKHLLLNSKIEKPSESVEQNLFSNLFKQKQKHYPQITMDQTKQMYGYPDDTPMPNYFYYAVPEGLLEADEVPPYAGLLYITTYKGTFENDPDKWYHDIKIVRQAPQLHKTKYTDGELNLGEKFYYNMKTWQRKYLQQVENSLWYREQLQDELAARGQDRPYKEMAKALADAESKAKMFEEIAMTNKQLYFTMVEGADYNSIERHMLMDVIKFLNPKFDFQGFMSDVEKEYKKRYPNRR